MTTYARFVKGNDLSRRAFCRAMWADHWAAIRAKREETAVKNLELIYRAVLELSNQKGFQAMSVRDLSRAGGLSMGALYAYFSGKDELLEMILSTGRRITGRCLQDCLAGIDDPADQLAALIRTHLFLSEALADWFFFSYMETRHLGQVEKAKAKESELFTERLLARIIRRGVKAGQFKTTDPNLTASLIKALLQDWYLKRWKYARRRVGVDRYARFVIGTVLEGWLAAGGEGKS